VIKLERDILISIKKDKTNGKHELKLYLFLIVNQMNNSDHMAWQQRITSELSAHRKYFIPLSI
jgi:hypothetical protein